MMICYIIFGATFFFSWYSILGNPTFVNNITSSFSFVFVEGAFFCVPVFFMFNGFLQTFSFNQKPNNKMFTGPTILRYYVTKIFRFMPLIAFGLIFGMFLLPLLGSGPIWSKYAKVMQPCQTYWWTTLLYINNFYPSNMDDRCMAFAWFIPCYV